MFLFNRALNTFFIYSYIALDVYPSVRPPTATISMASLN